MKRLIWAASALAAVAGFGFFARDELRALLTPLRLQIMGRATVEERVAEHGPEARDRLRPSFETAGVSYPPRAIVLAGFKRERELQLYAGNRDGSLRFIRSYPVLAASGGLGPKLREGDRQVPEGVYGVDSLNPNSKFHLSIRVGYPNAFDRARAQEEGRDDLGGDIMIHGAASSVGCLAIGDPAIEELFVLVADVGRENASIILSPVDMRTTAVPQSSQAAPLWLPKLYERIENALTALPAAPR